MNILEGTGGHLIEPSGVAALHLSAWSGRRERRAAHHRSWGAAARHCEEFISVHFYSSDQFNSQLRFALKQVSDWIGLSFGQELHQGSPDGWLDYLQSLGSWVSDGRCEEEFVLDSFQPIRIQFWGSSWKEANSFPYEGLPFCPSPLKRGGGAKWQSFVKKKTIFISHGHLSRRFSRHRFPFAAAALWSGGTGRHLPGGETWQMAYSFREMDWIWLNHIESYWIIDL